MKTILVNSFDGQEDMLDEHTATRLDGLLEVASDFLQPVDDLVRKVSLDDRGHALAVALMSDPNSFVAERTPDFVVIHNPHLNWSDHIDIDGELVDAHVPVPDGDDVPSEVITEALVSDGWQVHTAWFGPFAIVSRWPVN